MEGGPPVEVSVIVPTRDRPERLARTLATAGRQEGVATEVVVVDDGSEVPVSQPAADTVRLIRHATPRGVAVARNSGIAASQGEWLAFLDDDDFWAPTKLVAQLDRIRESGADFAFTDGVVIDDRGEVLFADDAPTRPGMSLHRQLLESDVIPCGCSNVLVRADVVRSIGGFDETFGTLADWDFNIRLSAVAAGVPVPERLIAYTLHAGNMHRDEQALAEELGRFDDKHAPARAREGVVFNRTQWLRWRASRHRSAGDWSQAASAYWRLGLACRDPLLSVRAIVLAGRGEPVLAAIRRWVGRDAPPTVPPPWLASALSAAGGR